MRTSGDLRLIIKSFASSRAVKIWTVSLLFTVLSSFALAGDEPKRTISDGNSAWSVWTEMTRSSLTFEPIEFQISPQAGAVSFGGEKEGGDSLITRIMSPSEADFHMILNSMRKDKRQEFLAALLNGLSRGRFQVESVVDKDGKKYKIPSVPEVRNYGTLPLETLEPLFKNWVKQTHDRPFAFLVPKVRAEIFDGEFAGMGEVDWIDRAMRVYPRVFDEARATDPVPTHFNNWKPIFGEPEKYISRMVTELLGDWELNFKPQTTYGEFEKMMHWFRDALKDEEGRYNAFGHQWIVLPKRPVSDVKMKALVEDRLAEVYKAAQALVTLRGIEMQSGILTSMYNEVRNDQKLRGHHTERSVLRLQDNLFGSNTGSQALNIEQRSGTSYNPTRRTVHQAIVSRYFANDWSGLVGSKEYTLVPKNPETITAGLEKRFGVSRFEALRCMERLGSVEFEGDEEMVKGLRANSLAPFWNWDDVPYLSDTKKALVKKVTREFIKQIAALPASNSEETQEKLFLAFARWSTITDIDTDIENYLKPAPQLVERGKFAYFRSNARYQRVDVNNTEVGVEFTTRFPLRAASQFTEEPMKMGKKAFLRIEYDLTPDEKRAVIYDIAKRLAKKLNGRDIEPTRVDSAGHGHKIAITYEIPHGNKGNWRIEWDGIGRDYDLEGNVLSGSERGGVVEIVTPKYKPTAKDVEALFEVYREVGVLPSYQSGGGHINFDLNLFAGRPKALARFIAIFLQSRDVLTAMFQYPGRFSTAEPHRVNQAFLGKLLDFNGTEEELKQLLYNGQFFNTRLGRKTKYVQMELSSYFQDVIPGEFVTKDFDIKHDVWRRQFRVNPNIRKGEFRFFGAPRTVEEAHLQQKLVRAMMDKAINSDTRLQGDLAEVDVEKMASEPLKLFNRFDAVMESLGLKGEEYEGFFADGLQQVQNYVESSFYTPYEEKMKLFPYKDGWKKAVKARPAERALVSKEGAWDPNRAEDDALDLYRLRQANARQANRARGTRFQGKPLPQRWREYSDDTVASLKSLPWDELSNYPEVAIEYVYERYAAAGDWTQAHSHMTDLGKKLDVDATLAGMIGEPRGSFDVSRIAFYTTMMRNGANAAYGTSVLLQKAGVREIETFFETMGQREFAYAAALAGSIEFRRLMYKSPGKKFETGWGDVVERIIALATTAERKKVLKEQLMAMLKAGDVALGKKERALIDKFASGSWATDLRALMNRRCNELFLK